MTTKTEPAIDLSLSRRTHPHGDITVHETWTLHNGRGCLVLTPTWAHISHERITPCIVTVDAAFMWDETTGDPQWCAETSLMFASALGLNPYEPRSVIQVTSIIREHLGDLLSMPPMPATTKAVVADAILTNKETGKTREAEIIDHVH